MSVQYKAALRSRASSVAALVLGLFTTGPLWAADFDCNKAATAIEKQICADVTLSELDSALGVAYRNYQLWELNKLQTLGTADYHTIEEYEQWQKGVIAQQGRWLREVRNACTTTDCLVKAYRARIAELNGQEAPLPSFRHSKNHQPALCAAMLEVLNRTPREQLGACTRHDFSGSPFSPVLTEASDELRLQFEQLNPPRNPPFEQRWPQIAERYQSGHRRLYAVPADIDGDGQTEWLLEVHSPSYRCEAIPPGTQEEQWNRENESRQHWWKLSNQSQLVHARQHGWISMVRLIKDGQLHLDSFGQLLRYQQQWVVLRQSQMYYKHNSNSLRNNIILYELPEKPRSYDGRWRLVESCSYWYNYE